MLCDTTVHKYSHHIFDFFLKSLFSNLLTAWILFKDAVSLCVARLDVRNLSSRGLVHDRRWEAWDRETTRSTGYPLTLPCLLPFIKCSVDVWFQLLHSEVALSLLWSLCRYSVYQRQVSLHCRRQHSITPPLHVFSICPGCCLSGPKNMGENITIFFKKGNLLIH